MTDPTCNPCCFPELMANSSLSYRAGVIKLLCLLVAGSGGSAIVNGVAYPVLSGPITAPEGDPLSTLQIAAPGVGKAIAVTRYSLSGADDNDVHFASNNGTSDTPVNWGIIYVSARGGEVEPPSNSVLFTLPENTSLHLVKTLDKSVGGGIQWAIVNV